jgi:hypothetical protein
MAFLILRNEAFRITRVYLNIRVELNGASGPAILLEVSISFGGG